MAVHRSSKGLDLPIAGDPEPLVDSRRQSTRVALLGDDYPGLRPTMFVKAGDDVRRGQALFEDKKTPGVRYASPGAGKVVAVHRGERRGFESIVIELSREDRTGRAGAADQVRLSSFTGKHPSSLSRDEVKELLLESGEWTAIRARPFAKVADPALAPHSVFVTAIDTSPLAAPVDAALEGWHGDFEKGLQAVAKLTDGPVFVCTAEETTVPVPQAAAFRHEIFRGPHPAGTVGYHIHVLDPVDRNKTVFYLGYQDVAAIGHLFATGELSFERVISLAGPVVRSPRLLRSRRGASLDEIVADELEPGENRVISGSVLSGRKAMGEVEGYLGRYHLQISAIREDRKREFLGWLTPGASKFSVKPAFLSSLIPGRKFRLTTSTNGSPRAIVPLGSYEKVMPMDLLPTFLLRALVMKDEERAEALGCLELDEEDLALLSFVDVGKTDFGYYLREVLTKIEKEG